jgi:hypothetical protein
MTPTPEQKQAHTPKITPFCYRCELGFDNMNDKLHTEVKNVNNSEAIFQALKPESAHPSLDSMLEDIFRNYTTDTILRHISEIVLHHRCQCTCENCMECKYEKS